MSLRYVLTCVIANDTVCNCQFCVFNVKSANPKSTSAKLAAKMKADDAEKQPTATTNTIPEKQMVGSMEFCAKNLFEL